MQMTQQLLQLLAAQAAKVAKAAQAAKAVQVAQAAKAAQAVQEADFQICRRLLCKEQLSVPMIILQELFIDSLCQHHLTLHYPN